MRKLFFSLLAMVVMLPVNAATGIPRWQTYNKTLSVKGGVGIVQFVKAITGNDPGDWFADPVYDKRNGYFTYGEEGDGHIEYHVSYWNRTDGKKLVIISYYDFSFGKMSPNLSSPWGYRSSTKTIADGVADDEGETLETGCCAYLYDEARQQLVPMVTPPFNGYSSSKSVNFLLILPQKGKDIKLKRFYPDGVSTLSTLKWNGMSFDLLDDEASSVDFQVTDSEANIRTSPNGKVVYTTNIDQACTLFIDRIENGWCHIESGLLFENINSETIYLKGSATGYWIHNSVIGARGMGNGGVRLHQSPSDDSPIVYDSEDDRVFYPIALKGEWVKVRIRGMKYEGWLRVTEVCSNPLTNCC